MVFEHDKDLLFNVEASLQDLEVLDDLEPGGGRAVAGVQLPPAR
jgi:hypothetical protein